MSNTIKQKKNWKKGKRLTPYATTPFKFKATKTCHVGGNMKGVTDYDKLVTRNANRSLKKGIRQAAKLMIKREVNDIYTGNR